MERMMFFEELLNVQEGVEVYLGKIITGIVIAKDKDGAYVSFGYRHDGFIPYAEWAPNATPDDVEIGTEVEAKIIASNTKSDFVRMSKFKAEQDIEWRKVKPLAEGEKRKVEVKVVGVAKNRAKVPVGLRIRMEQIEGFVPGSQIALNRVDDFDIYVGTTMLVEIIDMNIAERRLVCSRRNVLRQEFSEKRNHILPIAAEAKSKSYKANKIFKECGIKSNESIEVTIDELLDLAEESSKKAFTMGRVRILVNMVRKSGFSVEEVVKMAILDFEEHKKYIELVKMALE